MKPAKHLKNPDGTCSDNCIPYQIKTVRFASSTTLDSFPKAARAALKARNPGDGLGDQSASK